MRIIPRDPIGIGVVLLVVPVAPTCIGMVLASRRLQLGQPGADTNWWVSLGFHPPVVFLPVAGLLFILVGLFRRLLSRRSKFGFPERPSDETFEKLQL